MRVDTPAMPVSMRPDVRSVYRALLVALLLLIVAAPSAAQGFGIGGHMAMVRRDVDGDDDAVRFWGGHIRLGLGQRMALEVALDRRSEELELLNQRVKHTPIQASMLMYLAGGSFRPYVLGGPGWYRTSVEPFEDDGVLDDLSTTEFGWHGGFGAEIRAGRNFGFHGDYRYTFLDFNGDDDDDEDDGGILGGGVLGRFLPSYGGSMWTVGATLYF